MRFKIDELDVYFPYPAVYKEQYEYMSELKKALDARGSVILEMPTGTGKTVSLLSLIMSYLQAYPDSFKKLIYCTRTVPQMEKTLSEVHFIFESQFKEEGRKPKLLAVGLSAKKNLCIHPKVTAHSAIREKTEAECKKLIAPWIRQAYKGHFREDEHLCGFYEGFTDRQENLFFEEGVYSLADLKRYGEEQNLCPYFLARHMIAQAHVVVYSYSYILDPDINTQIPREQEADCIVVFDEAHNIDDQCVEAYKIEINRPLLDTAFRNIDILKQKMDEMKEVDKQRLEDEYNKLLKGMTDKGIITEDMRIQDAASSMIKDLSKDVIPGAIRQSEAFVSSLRRFVGFVKAMISIREVKIMSPTSFLDEMNKMIHLEQNTLKFFIERLNILMNTLEVADTHELMALSTVAKFGNYCALHTKGFTIIVEPYDDSSPDFYDPWLTFACNDASIGWKEVLKKFKVCILTSGTMSPMEMYTKILDWQPMFMKSFDITLRNCISPLFITRGHDHGELSSQFATRNDNEVMRNYGRLLTEFSSITPDGIICFFPSYRYMEDVVLQWNDLGVLDSVLKHKLVFIESKDVAETSLSLASFKKACENGRGAVFLSVARGKVAEGIDFDEHYGRCVIMFGVPFQYTKSRVLLAKLDYLRDTFQIKESDYLIFDAMRQCAQCVGRVIRKKNDYGLMVFADKRYAHADKREKLPKWIRTFIETHNIGINSEQALYKARSFFKDMGEDYKIDRNAILYLDDLRELEKQKQNTKPMEVEEDGVQDGK